MTGQEAVAALEKVGFEVVRTRGSHCHLKRPGHRFLITIPIHGKSALKRGALRQIIRTAGLTVEEFDSLL